MRRTSIVAGGLWIVVVLGWLTAAAAQACTTRTYGSRAVDPGDGALLYFERHRERLCDGVLVDSEVAYLGAHGDTIATKRLDFGSGLITPGVLLVDRRTGYREGVDVGPDSLYLFRAAADEEPERRALGLDGPAAVDAGFDHAVRRYWEVLAAGERVVFDFAVPDKLRTFAFRIRRLEPPTRRLRLRIEPASFWLRLIAPHIDLAYDTTTRRLLAYEGITNVRDTDGRRYRARITFDEATP